MAGRKKKSYKVILSPDALAELWEIEEYNAARHSLNRAYKIIDSIYHKLN